LQIDLSRASGDSQLPGAPRTLRYGEIGSQLHPSKDGVAHPAINEWCGRPAHILLIIGAS
jgi:hypothetical protein